MVTRTRAESEFKSCHALSRTRRMDHIEPRAFPLNDLPFKNIRDSLIYVFTVAVPLQVGDIVGSFYCVRYCVIARAG